MSLKKVIYSDNHQVLNGLVTPNSDHEKPGVLILPAWKGIDDEAKTAALELEKQGFIAFIADIYGEGNIPKDQSEAAKISSFYKKNYTDYQKRIELALAQLKKFTKGNKIAVIGYCFGGTGALEVARTGFPVEGVVSIHGGLAKDPSRPNAAISTKILVENPANDKSVTPEDLNLLIQEMNDGKADWQLITYANCGHTFTNPSSPEYNKIMAIRAWSHTLLFLNEILHSSKH